MPVNRWFVYIFWWFCLIGGQAHADQLTSFDSNGAYIKKIGLYKLDRVTLIMDGTHSVTPHEDFTVKVQSDGSKLLITNTNSATEGIQYQLLRSEDIAYSDDEGVEQLSGVKAYSIKDGILRHILVTQEKIEMTTFAPGTAGIRIVTGSRIF